MEDLLMSQLKPGEAVKATHRIHPIVLALPVFVGLVGLLQFTPWSFGPGAHLAGGVALAYGAFIGLLFWAQFRHGRVSVTDQRVVFLQKNPGQAPELSGWGRGDFDGMMVRRGVFGTWMGYGHLMLLKSGRLVTIIRTVRDVD
ncbi:MAG: hypothetical protein ACHQX0_08235, partial [Desulfobaccales bacterium]